MNQSQQYGDLLITLTSAYQVRYPDRGSGAHMDGTFWHPVGDERFKPLGSICVAGYDDINGARASMLVADAGNGAVAAPVDYQWIWDDSGSGADWDGSVWRPVAPAGYVALGDVAMPNHDKPSTADIWCVRTDLIADGIYAAKPWQDAGSGGEHDIAAWSVEVGQPATDPTKAVFAPDTFRGVASYDAQPSGGLAQVLVVPVVAEVGTAPTRPKLTSRNAPEPTTPAVRDRSVLLPFTAMFDRNDRPSLNRIDNPFCRVERWVSWSLVMFDDNTTSVSQSQTKETTVGVTKSASETFEHSTGIKVSAEWGVGTKWNVELNYQFTYSKTTGREDLTSDTISRTLVTPPDCAAALWTATYAFRATRADGTSIGRDLIFDANSFAHDQYGEGVSADKVSMAD
ncbi:Vps62-related protein [Novosphingobium sp. FSY-8]|uniref:Vps62-related protein n=1 Tax=Novosphingobium ovatum TaxID=1908523 RepID=A0ABW9X9P4_9SPHN|nr:Vps62-related protein [Novosphingobium ovatum]NBC35251.1 Vps62-related protein [Novosphingobium ovatum]